jgi:hypothetical protein
MICAKYTYIIIIDLTYISIYFNLKCLDNGKEFYLFLYIMIFIYNRLFNEIYLMKIKLIKLNIYNWFIIDYKLKIIYKEIIIIFINI